MHYSYALLFICHDSVRGFSSNPLGFGDTLSACCVDTLMKDEVVYLSHRMVS